MKEIENALFSFKDLKYRDFHSKLMPTIEKESVIGVRIPKLRQYAKEIYGSKKAEIFMQELPHKFYEENNLHAFLIAMIPDFQECCNALEKFLPFVDNWATCDSLRPKTFAKNKEKLLQNIEKWIENPHIYTARFGIEMLMVHFLDKNFKPQYLDWVAKIETDEYYLTMMKAWFFATALAKQYDFAISYLEGKKLDETTHNKTIKKAIESFRISEEHKNYLKNLKW